MSESIVRKTQPFTIGTKLSAPPAPQCSGFPDGYLSNRTFTDNCQLRHLNEQVSLYLGRSQVCDRRRGSPTSPVTPVKHHLEHLNRNTVSPNAASRSIRKITLSSGVDARLTPRMELKKISPNSENINNNNNITANTQLPKIVGVSCENKPKSHFKVLLCKDGEKQCSGDQEKFSASLQTQFFKTQTTRNDVPKLDSPPCEHKDTCVVSKASSAQNDHSFVQQNALFNKEITQAEAWIRAKLRDLRDDSNIQRCPLMDWDEVCQTLQRDLKDFENNIIQLNLMGEQLMCNFNPTSDLVKKQLAQLHDQWSTLKQTIAIQITAMGGAKSLQEFNKKVDRLEAWIQEKEEEQSLANILGENIDKMQLTRKILDLKQDEQLYRNLHEEINHMAIRLEKQGRTEGKSISTRRKHVNKMWQKAQSHSRDYHENLLLALEVSSFFQQADNVVCSINNMRKGFSLSSGVETSRDGEIRDIASQIMMLDVTVSQLSNLHPALASRVTQKQSEVKDCWSLLQNAVRNEKATQRPSAPLLTKEGSDPETQSQELPGSVGTDQGRIMGKEVKEEQNRLKGFTGGRDCERYGKPSDGQDDMQQCAAENPARVCASDFIVRLQTASESGNPSGPESRGHPALHTQLQKFTVSADKTLSWLKDSVTMATQICSLSGPKGFEAAKRCQATLERDILSNRERIELVKREGHSLVRAQHPGSTKIQEFLSQLEVLWEELKRRHQRNGLVLQVSEELNCRVVRVLQSLCSLEAWLEAVELSIRQASLAGDPESVSMAEQESCQLERELQDRGLELQNLRQEVHHLSTQRHLHTQLLPARLKDVEEKFSSVQAALTQQSSELKDTRMLTEFLEKVELEESNCSTLGEPLCGDLDSGPSLLGLPGNGHDEPLMESIGNPVEELREAVEMLNDTARERGRSQSHDQSIQELLSRHSLLSVRVEQCLQRCTELTKDVLEMESEMAVRCEPDRCGLDRLQEHQDKLEAEYKVLKVEMEAVENLAGRLTDVCPERMHRVRTDIQSSMNGWQELNKSVAENRRRLLQFDQLRQFFRNYLAMISWTEDTRSCIFSESALRQSRENQEPLVEVLDRQIEQKFEEFDQLTVTGKKLFDDKHHLNKMIQERMEELRSMLGWILVHWRAQKDQLLTRQRAEEAHTDAIYSEASVCTVQPQLETSPEDSRKKLESLSALPADLEDTLQHSDGYEVMMSVSPRGSDVSSNIERPDSPYLMLKEPSSPTLGGTVNLILSFGNSGDTQVQVQEPGRKGGIPVPEPVHRDPSMSLLSVHMGLETDDSDIQSVRQDLPSMEGTLERKHKLQLGGKKALCRTWNSYHAVLYKQTMCFYEDRKDTLRSCATSLPLNLIGAVCEPSPEYTKKPNCFCLRLRDKSEYLLSASSRFMMKKWILRIQAHTVSYESGVNRSTCHRPSAQTNLPRHSPSIRVCQCADKCLCSMRNYVSSTVLAQSQSASGRTKEIIVHTTDGLPIDRRHQDLVLTSSSGAGHCEDEFDSHGESLRHKLSAVSSIQGWTSEKRRSHSFTSATYQRIKPVLAPPTGRGQDNSSSYSVTLFIGDREATSVCTNTVMAQTNGDSQESISELPLRSYMSLPRPRNKSVFRKFFGKKE
ncbi:spectrin alpha chain-like isoform X4 [Myxocyprinus asiaticus]|uniref:spectrin alpha chain-like isoform X4 n=1 Tax=Myxocyprinus asiaticus TaxID=70543 RepID=UPI002222F3EC|nr:spectrin alpha chain-like isoform X4 [Myxocyprinus asiaticus]